MFLDLYRKSQELRAIQSEEAREVQESSRQAIRSKLEAKDNQIQKVLAATIGPLVAKETTMTDQLPSNCQLSS